jgi:hypothetical protein
MSENVPSVPRCPNPVVADENGTFSLAAGVGLTRSTAGRHLQTLCLLCLQKISSCLACGDRGLFPELHHGVFPNPGRCRTPRVLPGICASVGAREPLAHRFLWLMATEAGVNENDPLLLWALEAQEKADWRANPAGWLEMNAAVWAFLEAHFEFRNPWPPQWQRIEELIRKIERRTATDLEKEEFRRLANEVLQNPEY